MTGNNAPQNWGNFTPEVMGRLKAMSQINLEFLLSDQQVANVGLCIHPSMPLLISAYYGTASRVDLWDLQHRRHLHGLDLMGSGHDSERDAVMLVGGGPGQNSLPIRDIDISPEGKLVAVAAGNDVRLLSMSPTGTFLSEMAELEDQQQSVQVVAFSHSGNYLLSADSQGSAVLWDMTTYAVAGRYPAQNSNIQSAAFSFDDKLIAIGDARGNVIVWDLTLGKPRAHFQASQGEIKTIAFSPNNYLMATGGADGKVALWDMSVGKPFGQPMHHGDTVYDLIFTNNGQALYSCSFDSKIGVWQVSSQTLMDCYINESPILAMADFPNGSHMAFASMNGLKVLSNTMAKFSTSQPALLRPQTSQALLQRPHTPRNPHAALQAPPQRAPSGPPPIPGARFPGAQAPQPAPPQSPLMAQAVVSSLSNDYIKARQSAIAQSASPFPAQGAPGLYSASPNSQSNNSGMYAIGPTPKSGMYAAIPTDSPPSGGSGMYASRPGPTPHSGMYANTPSATPGMYASTPNQPSHHGGGSNNLELLPTAEAMGAGYLPTGGLANTAGLPPGVSTPEMFAVTQDPPQATAPPRPINTNAARFSPDAKAVAAEKAAKQKTSKLYSYGLGVATIVALFGGLIGYIVTPSASSHPDYPEQAAAVSTLYNNDSTEEMELHTSQLKPMELQLERLEIAGEDSSKEVQNLVAQLRVDIKDERTRHLAQIDKIRDTKEQSMDVIEDKLSTSPVWYVATGAVGTFALIMMILAIALQVLSRQAHAEARAIAATAAAERPPSAGGSPYHKG